MFIVLIFWTKHKYILKLKANAKHFPFSFSYAGRSSGYKFANTEKSVQALVRPGIIRNDEITSFLMGW